MRGTGGGGGGGGGAGGPGAVVPLNGDILGAESMAEAAISGGAGARRAKDISTVGTR